MIDVRPSLAAKPSVRIGTRSGRLRRSAASQRLATPRLLVGMFVMTAGTTSSLPMAPLWVGDRGGDSLMIALFVGGPLVAGALAQVPAGRLADRYGRRVVLAVPLAVYSLLSIPLFLSMGSLWQLCLIRIAQGLCVGAYLPALRASLIDRSPPGHRASALSRLQAVTQLGFFAGPIIGGFLATVRDGAVFAAGGAATLVCLVALIPVRDVRIAGFRAGARRSPDAVTTGRSKPAVWRSPGFVLGCGALAANMLVLNAYEITWPQYMSSRGFGTIVIGVSIALYALPLALLSVWGGALIDRLRPRVLLGVSFLVSGACVASYPALHALSVILLVNALEAAATVAIQPGLYAAITRSAPPTSVGRSLGIAGAFENAGGAVGAIAVGALYGVSAAMPFWVSGAILAGAAIACAVAAPRLPREIAVRSSAALPVTVLIRTGLGGAPAAQHRACAPLVVPSDEQIAELGGQIATLSEQIATLRFEVAEWMAYARRLAEAQGEVSNAAWARERELITIVHRQIITIQNLEAEVEARGHEQELHSPARISVLAG